ncbi:nucleolus and neural progenitor protein isoform X2 [Amblyraja radiata]|uniref:nucleolus and neural progenitor protein isoform X2 n=1 Tax=Amblyraja radiata TaxID=386614 RepID=UPI0014025924|nr:nucleolus and neural progenitor protein isoform X2 [Amblyraja radiata]
MAAGGWNATEVWNAVDIPFPGSTSLTVACTDLDSCIIDLHKACENAIRVLTDKSLTVELLVLHSIIYTFHNRLYRHKPYLVIKQVEQCAKRFQKMQLKHSIQSLINTCSSVTRKRRMVTNCPKRVPNQPVLEWMSLKVLGGSKLILRLMDMCSKAFLLASQFLRYGRYIILNVVTMGMLSRLWFLFKRILIYLEVLYDKLVVAINKVSKIQPLPFMKDFSFPGSIKQWLGLSSIKGTLDKLPGRLSRKTRVLLEKPSLLDKLFSEEEEEALLLSDDHGIQLDGNYNNDPKINSRFLDIGVPVQGKRLCKIGTDGQFGFKMKSLQAQSRNFFTNQNSEGEYSCKRKKKNERVPLNEFLEKITAAQSFSVLSHELKTIFRWFRQRKLKHERCYFGNLYQKCHKLKMVECLGYSFPKKIKFIKSSVCKYLTKKFQTFQRDKIFNYRLSRTTLLRKHKIRNKKQLKCKIQSRRNKSLLKKYRRTRLTAKKRNRKLHTIPHFDIDEQASVKRQSVTTDMSAEPVGDIGPDQSLKNVPHPPRTESPVMLNVDDIDDIFASIGV